MSFSTEKFLSLRSQTIIANFLIYNEEKRLSVGSGKMKTYELYLIQEDIAKAYFGREYLF